MGAKRRGGARRWRLVLVALATSIAVFGSGLGTHVAGAAPQAPTQASSVAEYFSRPGPWGPVRSGSADVPAAEGVRFWYPERIATAGTTFPILSWGNGTGASADTYSQLIEHLAAWGFVVVASNSTQTGTGEEMLAAAEWMVAQNRNPGSVFYQRLRTDRVGAVGHSQGAGGAIRAAALSGGSITSTLPIALPDLFYWQPRPTEADVRALGAQVRHPVFFMYGDDDFIADDRTEQRLWFEAVGGAALTAAHDDLHHGIAVNDNLCTVYRVWTFELEFCGQASPMLGYATAWFSYTLRGDGFARGAFVAPDGTGGEIIRDEDWERQAFDGLP